MLTILEFPTEKKIATFQSYMVVLIGVKEDLTPSFKPLVLIFL